MKRVAIPMAIVLLSSLCWVWRMRESHALLPPAAIDGAATPVPDRNGPPELATTNNAWQPLFNGRDLAGWRQVGGGQASVQNGALTLSHDADRRSGYLVSSVTARNFQAHVLCQIPAGDSGLYYRGRFEPRTPTDVLGLQVQLNIQPESGLGGLFEAQGRGWLKKPAPDLVTRVVQAAEWLDCLIDVQDDHVRVTINGIETVDFTDRDPDNRYREAGFFALQIHGGGACEARFREIAVRILD